MITLTDLYQWLNLIFDGFGGFVDILGTTLGELTGSAIIQGSQFGNLTLIGVLLGVGSLAYVVVTLVKWVKNIIL